MNYDYSSVISKSLRLNHLVFLDDYKNGKDKEFFRYTGTQVYVGRQGSGKTISAVRDVLRLKKQYPKAIVVTNLLLNVPWTYIYFQSPDELAEVLVNTNNGKYGVIYVIDEIHTYFNALDSKNIPMFVFTEISQQRKQRKLIIGTSQLFLRVAKPLREQCNNIIICRTHFNKWTTQTVYDGYSLSLDDDGFIVGDPKGVGFFMQTREIRNSYDTFQKVVSSSEQMQYENFALKPRKQLEPKQSRKALGSR